MIELTLVILQGFVMLADSDKTTEHDDKVQQDYVEVPAAGELASVSISTLLIHCLVSLLEPLFI